MESRDQSVDGHDEPVGAVKFTQQKSLTYSQAL